MAMFCLPYGKDTIQGEISDAQLAGVIESGLNTYDPRMNGQQLVAQAMVAPIGSPRLCELAKGKKNVVVLISDHTRPVPSQIILPPMLREIRQGNPEAEITLLVATGCHRETTAEELRSKLGEEIFRYEKIVVHDCDDTANLVALGTLPSGGELKINRLACEADLLVAEGFIEPHFFAGFSGGRKSVLPGVAGRESVLGNHCAEFIDHPRARTGLVEGNPIHRDMLWAAKRAGLAYIVNVVLNEDKQVIHAVAGDCEAAHAAGCAFLLDKCRAKPVMADVVISTNGGYPLDQNIYQAVKGMTAAEATVREGGVIIMVAKSNDGHGGERFFHQLADEADVSKTMQLFRSRDRHETAPDQWQSQIFIRILQRAKVLYLSDAPDDMVRALHMEPIHSLEEGLNRAAQIMRKPAPSVTVIPDGVSVMVTE